MRVYLGSDHAGFKMKVALKDYFDLRGFDLVDMGVSSEDPVDYPDYAEKVAQAVAAGEAKSFKLAVGISFIRYKNTQLKKYYGRILFFSTAKEVKLRLYKRGY